MYSPKIKEELIPKIYEMAKKKGVKMTKLVNDVLETAMKGLQEQENLSKEIMQAEQGK